MIQAQRLTKVFGTTIAVSEFSCDLSMPCVVGLLGANGAGKTTIMRMLSGYFPPTSGRAFIGGYDVFLNPLKARRLVGYLPETTPLYRNMRVSEYLKYMGILQDVGSARLLERIGAAISACDLEEVASWKISRLSRGYQQRIGLAQALLSDPPVLIVDEPTSALDPMQIQKMRKLLKKMGEVKTILISTHILFEVEQICDRVIILHKGRTVLDEALKDIRRADRILLEVDADYGHVCEKLTAIAGVRQVHIEGADLVVEADRDVRHKIWELCREYNWPLLKMCHSPKTLESIYLESAGNFFEGPEIV